MSELATFLVAVALLALLIRQHFTLEQIVKTLDDLNTEIAALQKAVADDQVADQAAVDGMTVVINDLKQKLANANAQLATPIDFTAQITALEAIKTGIATATAPAGTLDETALPPATPAGEQPIN